MIEYNVIKIKLCKIHKIIQEHKNNINIKFIT